MAGIFNGEILNSTDFNFIKSQIIDIVQNDESELRIRENLALILVECNKFLQSLQDNSSLAREVAYKQGASLIFNLRRFLLDEEITIWLGITAPTGELTEYGISQDNMLKNLKIDLKNDIAFLDKNLNDFKEISIPEKSMLWKLILSYSTFVYDKEDKEYYEDDVYYKNEHPDTDVYGRFLTSKNNRKNLYLYYKQTSDYMLNFNRGWLYEWFNAHIQDKTSYLELKTSLLAGGNTPLKKMMNASASKRERVEGRKGGDFIEKGGRQIQAKMENQKIISLKDITYTIGKIKEAIAAYGNYRLTKNTMENQLTNIFSHKETRRVNESYENVAEKILSNLNSKTIPINLFA